jgi:hypothetical protein
VRVTGGVHFLLPVLLLALAVGQPLAAAAEQVAPVVGRHAAIADPGPYAAVVPGRLAAVRAATEETALRYEIEARLDPEEGILNGELRLDFVNTTPDTLYDAFFRLLPNADYSGYATMTITALEVGGDSLSSPDRYRTASGLSVRVPLATELSLGEETAFRLGFRVEFTGPALYGMLGPSPDRAVWSLVYWYPLLAAYKPWSGWQLDGDLLWGGTSSPAVALYDVSLTVPSDVTLATNGRLVGMEGNGDWVTGRYLAGPIHEFFVVAGKMSSFAESVGDTIVTVYVPPDRAEIGQAALRTATGALAAYGERFGAYPLSDLALIEHPIPFAAGVAFDGLILFDARSVEGASFLNLDGDALSEAEQRRLERLIAHEVGHQWWGYLVASNNAAHAFMVEGLTEYVSILYVGWTYGAAAAERALIEDIAEPYAEVLAYYGDAVPDLTAVDDDEFPGSDPAFVYGKAALGFFAIHQEIGDRAFLAALLGYAEDHAFGYTTPDHLRDAFEDASDESIAEIWRFWFEQDDATAEDVRDLIRAA